jgi:hypothetical protein
LHGNSLKTVLANDFLFLVKMVVGYRRFADVHAKELKSIEGQCPYPEFDTFIVFTKFNHTYNHIDLPGVGASFTCEGITWFCPLNCNLHRCSPCLYCGVECDPIFYEAQNHIRR